MALTHAGAQEHGRTGDGTPGFTFRDGASLDLEATGAQDWIDPQRFPVQKEPWMSERASATAEVYAPIRARAVYGLHAGVLGPIETLAQSVSAMAPSTAITGVTPAS